MLNNNADNEDNLIKNMLLRYKIIAIVGLSDKIHRDSYLVANYMQRNGFKIIPVNPGVKKVLGETAYKSLLDIPEKADIVNVFRRSDQVGPIVEEAIKIQAKAIWMQLGIANKEAAMMANAAGMECVMDKCIKVEHQRLLGIV